MFRRNKGFNRSKLLGEAARAHEQGRLRKAAGLYSKVLEVERGNMDVHRKAGPLFARVGRLDLAAQSFELVAREFSHSGRHQHAIGIYREALHYLPRRADFWLAMAEAHRARECTGDAVRALLEGRDSFRRRRDRGDAIRLLSAARTLDPMLIEPSFELAVLLHRTGQRQEAQHLLDELGRTLPGQHFRRVRWLQLNFHPTPAALWRLICVMLGGRASAASA